MFGVELNNTDKVRVYINNFTDLIISDDLMFVNDHLADTSIPEIYPKILACLLKTILIISQLVYTRKQILSSKSSTVLLAPARVTL